MQKLLTDIGKKSKKAINKRLSTKKKDKVLKEYRLQILKNKRLIINENGIKGLKISSKVREFEIQYKLETKYPKPNIQPILKHTHFPLE